MQVLNMALPPGLIFAFTFLEKPNVVIPESDGVIMAPTMHDAIEY